MGSGNYLYDHTHMRTSIEEANSGIAKFISLSSGSRCRHYQTYCSGIIKLFERMEQFNGHIGLGKGLCAYYLMQLDDLVFETPTTEEYSGTEDDENDG